MPIPDWPRPFNVRRSSLHSLLLPFQTEPASLGFGLGTREEARSTPHTCPRTLGANRAVSLQGCKQRYAPSGSHARNCPVFRAFPTCAETREGSDVACFSICPGVSDQFPPNIQYFTGSTPYCQSFFRHLRRFFPGNFVNVSRNWDPEKIGRICRRPSGKPSASSCPAAPLAGEPWAMRLQFSSALIFR